VKIGERSEAETAARGRSDSDAAFRGAEVAYEAPKRVNDLPLDAATTLLLLLLLLLLL